jgi:Zn-dependent oligopeptidase
MELIKFNYTVSEINNISDKIINNHKKWFENIKNKKDICPSDFLDSYLYDSLNNFDYIYNTIIFLRYVSEKKDIRNASSDFDLKIKKYFSDFYSSTENYKIFTILENLDIDKYDKNNSNNTKKLIKNILKNFEEHGCNLKASSKKIFSKLQNKLITLENRFSNNISNDVRELKFSRHELDGIDASTLNLHYNKGKNKYIFNTTYPDQSVILKDCSVEKSRMLMYNTFNSIAPQNLQILEKILSSLNSYPLLLFNKLLTLLLDIIKIN